MSYRDFSEFILILNRHRVRYVVIGGFAIAFHGLPRATDDVDGPVEQTAPNIRRLERALLEFAGVAPRPGALLRAGGKVRIGGSVVHVDVTTKVDGIASFGPVWKRRVRGEFLGVKTQYMSARDLLRTKQAADRPKDQGDIAFLTSLIRGRAR